MPSKRSLCFEENNQVQSKKAKLVKAIQACLTKKPAVKLIDVAEEINQKKTLFEVIKNQDVTGVENLLKINVDLNTRDKTGFTPLHHAVYFEHLDVVKILVKNGANLEGTNLAESPLQIAIARQNHAISKYLLENGAKVNADNHGFYPPLMNAVQDGRVDLVKLLISHGALVNVNYNLNNENETPLQIAIKYLDFEIIQVLLDNGADPNYSGNSEDSIAALDEALELVDTLEIIIKTLLKHGADRGLLVQRAMISVNCLKNVEMLLKIGVDVNATQIGEKNTPLHYAVANIDIVHLLIRFGADVNAKGFYSRTPLHYAFNFRVNDFKILKVLMQNGANPNLKDEDGESTTEKTLKYKTTKYFKAILFNQIYL